MQPLPTVKKSVKSFMLSEEGKISKEKIVRLGVVSGITLAVAPGFASGETGPSPCDCDSGGHVDSPIPEVDTWNHTNSFNIIKTGNEAYAEHSHTAGTHTNTPASHNDSGYTGHTNDTGGY